MIVFVMMVIILVVVSIAVVFILAIVVPHCVNRAGRNRHRLRGNSEQNSEAGRGRTNLGLS